MKWPDHDEPPACSRLHAWLNIQDTHASIHRSLSIADTQSTLQAAVDSLRNAQRPLIWLESVDVPAARAAVQLAQATGATLHVAQSPGAELVADITATDGWLGTTLAEVGSTASLVIHLGQQHLRDAPMFELRYMNPAAQHVFLDSCPESLAADPRLQESVMQLQWPKATWLDRLTRLLLLLRDDSSALARRADSVDSQVGMLAEMLLGSHYTVLLWGEDELSDELDGLLVRRLLELARQVSRTVRCSLLCLPQDPGRVTAKDCILWLTNRTTPLRCADNRWTKELLNQHSLDEWQQAYDWIMCIRNLPSDRPLPELRFDVVLDSRCNPSSSSQDKRSILIPVQAVGLDVEGHLMRADHGLAAHLPAIDSSPEISEASGLLNRMTELVGNDQQSRPRGVQ